GVVVNPTVIPLTITPPTTANEGLPAAFSVVVGTLPAGDAVQNVTIDWGDNSDTQSLGAISGTSSVQHVFAKAGTYLVKATLTDTAGNSQPVSTSVSVVPTPLPTVNVSASV